MAICLALVPGDVKLDDTDGPKVIASMLRDCTTTVSTVPTLVLAIIVCPLTNAPTP